MGLRRAVAVLVVLAVAGGCAKESDESGRPGRPDGPRVNTDHWHTAFGVYVCDDFEPDLPRNESPAGIHTHGDGVIHIHPFTAAGAGANATLETFLGSTDVDLDPAEVGADECDGVLQIAWWEDLDGDPTIVDDPADVRFTADEQAVTVAFVADDDEIPQPPSVDDLAELGGIDSPDSPTTTRPPPVDADPADIDDGFYPVVAVQSPGVTCSGPDVVPGRDDGQCYAVAGESALSTDIVESAELEVDSLGERILLVLTEDGIDRFNDLAADCYATDHQACPTGQLAIVVGGEVVSAPTITEPSFERDQISISGSDLDAVADALDP